MWYRDGIIAEGAYWDAHADIYWAYILCNVWLTAYEKQGSEMNELIKAGRL